MRARPSGIMPDFPSEFSETYSFRLAWYNPRHVRGLTSMESLFIAWRFFLLFGILAFTQLFGLLLFYRLRWAPRWIAVIAGILAPAVFFVLLAPIFFFGGSRETSTEGPTCGTAAMGAILLLYAGAIVQLFLGVVVQAFLFARRRQAIRP